MSYSEEIDKALAAHGQWKRRLQSAIESGSSEFSVAQVQIDNECAFGKWFYSLPSNVRTSDKTKEIQQLHASFHKEAARILGMALKGNKAEALLALGSNTQFVRISGQLAITLNQWKQSLGNK